MSPDTFPTQFVRERLDRLGALPAAEVGGVRGHGTGY